MPDSLSIPARPITRLILPVVIAAAMLSSSGCLFQKKQTRVFHPPPPLPRPVPAALKLPPDMEPPSLPDDTETGLDVAELVAVNFDFPPPPPPVRAPRPRAPIAASPKPAVVAPVTPEALAPKIVQIFPPEQLRLFNRELDDILERDSKTLVTVARKNPNADQRERMAQIRELLTQAKQAREQDLVTAVSLAKRADTLTKDLLDRLLP